MGDASMPQISQHLIHGEDVSSTDLFDVFSPETGKVVSRGTRCTAQTVEAAIASSSKAFTAWKTTPYVVRRDLMNKAADTLFAMRNDIVSSMCAETGSKSDWAMGANVHGASGLLREVASLASHIKGEVLQSTTPGTTTLVTLEPAGVVFAVAPWNSPVILSCRAIAVAIICGCTVILKSSEFSPRTQRYVAEAFRAAGFPEGVLNFVNMGVEEAPEMSELFVRHEAVRRVNFTGSARVGRVFAEMAARYGPKECVLELGGKAPFVVLGDADLDAAADAVVFSSLYNSGQICMSAERIIVMNSIADAFVEKLKARIGKLWTGPAAAANDTDRPEYLRIGPLFCKASAKRVISLITAAVSSGVGLPIGDLQQDGCFVKPHLLDFVSLTSEIFNEETFGPVCAVSRAQSVEEAIKLANHGDYSLTAVSLPFPPNSSGSY
jgi:acyl-CoA reductase-like NAD-dependent aldehyde dehydrogenase